jgi:radical SAM protein with 4Fe4S-binding SPASM domain
VGYTIYKENKINYSNYPKLDEAERVINYLQDKYYGDSSIVISPIAKLEDMYHYDDNKFLSKARCSGNMYGFIILPDGNITICEELYWHPEFIIGNINKQSILEVWSSQKANDLFYLQQSLLDKKSACSSCESFSICRHRGGVCWREVIKTYGVDCWNFPDPRCKFAPEKINNLYIG